MQLRLEQTGAMVRVGRAIGSLHNQPHQLPSHPDTSQLCMHSILQRIQELAQKLGEFEAGLPDRLDAAAARAIATGKVERFLGLTPEVSALAHQYVTWKWRTREVRGAGEQWL